MVRWIIFPMAFASFTSHAQVQKFDTSPARRTRAQLIRMNKQYTPSQTKVIGEFTSPQAKEFIAHYLNVMEPRLEEQLKLGLEFSTLRVLSDAAAYRNKREFKRWKLRQNELMSKFTASAADENWTRDIERWADLAKGLEGQLPDFARQLAEERKLEAMSPELRLSMNEIFRLVDEFQMALNSAPAASQLGEISDAVREISVQFKNNEISFVEATKRFQNTLNRGGSHHVGHYAVQKFGENLNQAARLRTRFARGKGFATWAEYQLEYSGQGYTTEYRGATNQKRFLKELINELRPLRESYLEQRVKELGIEADRDLLSEDSIGLLLPAGLARLHNYLPKETITPGWERTLLESGFANETLRQILVDDGLREGKMRTGAYMSSLIAPRPETSYLNAETLEYLTPQAPLSEWKKGFAYIMQNYAGSAMAGLETAFHEGGHALERLLKNKLIPTDESYGYVEVPSMTMERFARDPKVVYGLLTPFDGHLPSLEEAQNWLNESQQADIIELMHLATSALFDTELWDYNYDAEGAQTYMERVEYLVEEINELSGAMPTMNLAVPTFYRRVATSHFISGNVRNIGYTYAEMASRMMTDFISDRLEEQTGRRDWYQQPGLAKIFTESFFQQGWKKKFPENIEEITGRKFSPAEIVGSVAGKLQVAPPNCDNLLTDSQK